MEPLFQLNFKTLPVATKDAYDAIKHALFLQDHWYLAGGTAMALQCGNRVSEDLDFFTTERDFDISYIISQLQPLDFTLTSQSHATLYGIVKGAKVSFIAYPFFKFVQPTIQDENIKVIHIDDIAVMKVIAVSQRGKKRDFFDLYWYLQNRMDIRHVLAKLDSQYPNTKHTHYHILKSLAYFEDAEPDADPVIFFKADWRTVKAYFQDLANTLLHEYRGP